MLRTNTVGHDVCVRRAMMHIQYDYVHYERHGADQHDYTDIRRYKHTHIHIHLYTDMIVDDSAELRSLLRAKCISACAITERSLSLLHLDIDILW